MALKHRYNKKLDLTKAGTGVEYIEDDAVESGKILVYESIAVVDENSSLSYIRIGAMTPSYYELWEEELAPNANELCFSQEEHTIRELQRFRCEINGGTANDKIHVYLTGYWQNWRE